MGYVYVMTHKERMCGLVKIGYTEHLKKRVSVLNTSVPEDFRVELVFDTKKYTELESWLRNQLKGKQRGSRATKEFYECSVEDIRSFILKSPFNSNGRFVTSNEISSMLQRNR